MAETASPITDGLDRKRIVTVLTLTAVVLAVGLWLSSASGPLGGVLSPVDYENSSVTISDANGETLATVDVRVADSSRERYIGLSDTDSLAAGEGMLFVHEQVDEHVYVMRDMDFPLDIIFVAPNGTITTIHHAPVPGETADSSLRRYRGTGLYILEVPRGFTNATNVTVGDRVSIPSNVAA